MMISDFENEFNENFKAYSDIINKFERISNSYMDRPFEIIKTDFINDLEDIFSKESPINMQDLYESINMIISQLTYYRKMTIGKSLNFGRCAYVDKENSKLFMELCEKSISITESLNEYLEYLKRNYPINQ